MCNTQTHEQFAAIFSSLRVHTVHKRSVYQKKEKNSISVYIWYILFLIEESGSKVVAKLMIVLLGVLIVLY